jgi:uncharacterized protein (TIGR03435 family)
MNTFTKYLLRVGVGLLLTVSAIDAQLTAASPAFEVATIRPSAAIDQAALRSGRAHLGIKVDGARVDIGTASLFRLICAAYRLRPYQVSGPEWLKTTNFDLQAKIPDNVIPEQVPEMLQALLTERFGLQVHHENKEQPVFALVVSKGGPRLSVSASDPAPEAATTDSEPQAATMSVPTAEGEVKMIRTAHGIRLEMPGGEINASVRVSLVAGPPPGFHVESSHITMKTLAELLSIGVLDRPVVDSTNLSGYYDIAMDMSTIEAMNLVRNSTSFLAPGGGDARRAQPAEASEPAGASILSSIQKLGLRLEPRKLPLGALIVEHIEKVPTAN